MIALLTFWSFNSLGTVSIIILYPRQMLSASPGARHNLHDVPDVRPHNTPSDQYVRDGGPTHSKDVKLSVYALTVCLKRTVS